MSRWRKLQGIAETVIDLGLFVTSFFPGRTKKARRYLDKADQVTDVLDDVLPEEAEMPGGVQIDDIPAGASKFCTYCGTRWSPNARFCGKCGHPLSDC